MTNSQPFIAPTRTEISAARINRRRFIYSSALAAGALAAGSASALPRVKFKSPNEKLDIGGIGAGGRGRDDIEGVSGENIVALCDVDSNALAGAGRKYPRARLYADYRVMLEKEKNLDAVTVGIPDHHHAPGSHDSHDVGQTCLLRKAADAHDLGSPRDGASGAPI